MQTLNDNEINRQDLVDNAIYNLLQELNPSERNIEWNIEIIGEIRDVIQAWFVERLAITDEMSFYPYIDIDAGSTKTSA
ncbi:MAG: hypothetical protein IT311_01770 [Anaerolineales bacterium]|nr:hypothetical protein [Anaerolineales bacterium]